MIGLTQMLPIEWKDESNVDELRMESVNSELRMESVECHPARVE